MDKRGTISPDQHAALELLRSGPALLGPRTEQTQMRRIPGSLSMVANPTEVLRNSPGERVEVRTVNTKVARSLERDGLVTIDAGGLVTIVEVTS